MLMFGPNSIREEERKEKKGLGNTDAVSQNASWTRVKNRDGLINRGGS